MTGKNKPVYILGWGITWTLQMTDILFFIENLGYNNFYANNKLDLKRDHILYWIVNTADECILKPPFSICKDSFFLERISQHQKLQDIQRSCFEREVTTLKEYVLAFRCQLMKLFLFTMIPLRSVRRNMQITFILNLY